MFYITTFYIPHQCNSKLCNKPEHKITQHSLQVIILNKHWLKYFKTLSKFSQMFASLVLVLERKYKSVEISGETCWCRTVCTFIQYEQISDLHQRCRSEALHWYGPGTHSKWKYQLFPVFVFLGKSLIKLRKISKENYYKKYSIDHSNIKTMKTGRKLKGNSQNVATELDDGQWHSVERVQYQYQVSLHFFLILLFMCASRESSKQSLIKHN